MKKECFKQQVVSGILGSVIGDALGVPGEFLSREELMEEPIVTMTSGGVHDQRIGTWSDDTSMTLCTIDSLLTHGFDFQDQMQRFYDWLWNANYTAHDEVFDVGGATRESIFRFVKGTPALACGSKAEYSCGNGSLMRIFPTVMYIIGHYGNTTIDDRAAQIIHNTSRCTHAHPTCLMACGLFFSVVASLSTASDPRFAIKQGIKQGLAYYKDKDEFTHVYNKFTFLLNIDQWSVNDVKSSGYVIDTLQAALWCLYTSNNLKECLLKAVNLGEDTDTVGAVTGAIAGMWFKEEQIPTDWKNVTVNYEKIKQLSLQFSHACLND